MTLAHSQSGQQLKHTVTPKTWDDRVMNQVEVPLANAIGSPRQVAADYYYKIPERPIYRQYPVYAPGREPAGYMDELKKKDPVILWDGAHTPRLQSDEDWEKAGEMVFSAPITYSADQGLYTVADLRDREWYRRSGMPVTSDGVVPFLHYVIREKGKVEVGSFSCAMCHTRVMPDGNVITGAQGNFPLTPAAPQVTTPHPRIPVELLFLFNRQLYAMPWLNPDPIDRQLSMSPRELDAMYNEFPKGVLPRHRTSPFSPVQVPDLIGVQDRRYLDHTGLHPHSSIVDLMRYAALNQGADFLADFAGFIPADLPNFKHLPDPADPIAVGGRYSDDQLYALARYVYSLKPPVNPNRFDTEAARGQKIFAQQGCANCHTPHFYTNNKLTPADGFSVPADHLSKYDILPVRVGTDPELALKTRRGTGYYKVPSLKGVWYRSMFGHSGWCATLEDWFDPKRVRSDYVPTGFKPYGSKTFAVKGHPFGLDLSSENRAALIAFLKTL